MVNTIHRSIVERFHVEVTDIIVDMFTDNEVPDTKLEISDEEKFKDALKKNIPCTVHRETFVVEHDDDRKLLVCTKFLGAEAVEFGGGEFTMHEKGEG